MQHSTFSRALALFAAAAVAAAPAAAQTVNFSGTTVGSFNGGAFTNPATLGGLTIAGGSFNVTTNGGFAGIGGSGINLGVASLGTQAFSYAGNSFGLRVTFNTPSGANTQTFNGTLVGSVANGVGGLQLTFAPSTVPGTYPGGGTYALTVNPLSLTPGQSNVEITGFLTATAATTVPEPSTYALMATGVLGLVGAMARRRDMSA